MNSKIDKPGVMGFKVSIGCPCAPLDHQNGTQVPKMEPSGLQNHGLGGSQSLLMKIGLSNPNAKNCKEPCTPSELPKRKKNLRCGGVASAFSIYIYL